MIREKEFDPNVVILLLLKWDGKRWIDLSAKLLKAIVQLLRSQY
ncbi:MAG: hypothetical protein NZ895_00400 [Archaeoglobaceae archaeon]|nr:hypothetical protein [Archaeoglobaceae archaeon]